MRFCRNWRRRINFWYCSICETVASEIKIIGVEPVDADAMDQSLKAGHRVRLSQVGLFADGVAVREVGVETFRLCQKYVDEIILGTDDTCAAIKDVFEDTRSILEPAGALAIAAAKAYGTGANPGTNINCRCLRCQHEL
jgi:threonine dehydratase